MWPVFRTTWYKTNCESNACIRMCRTFMAFAFQYNITYIRSCFCVCHKKPHSLKNYCCWLHTVLFVFNVDIPLFDSNIAQKAFIGRALKVRRAPSGSCERTPRKKFQPSRKQKLVSDGQLREKVTLFSFQPQLTMGCSLSRRSWSICRSPNISKRMQQQIQ